MTEAEESTEPSESKEESEELEAEELEAADVIGVTTLESVVKELIRKKGKRDLIMKLAEKLPSEVQEKLGVVTPLERIIGRLKSCLNITLNPSVTRSHFTNREAATATQDPLQRGMKKISAAIEKPSATEMIVTFRVHGLDQDVADWYEKHVK